MKVFKFGGASVNSIDRIKNVAGILKEYQQEPLLIIISAMGKTTNALEKVAEAFFAGKQDEALKLFDLVKQNHLTTAKFLLVTHYNKTLEQLINYFTEAEWLLHDKPVRDFDYYYDQIVCVGELLSTCIVSAYLNETGINNRVIDVRDVLRTDNIFRDATIDWEETKKLAGDLNLYSLENSTAPKMVITQGFIGSTSDNESTTLGREGSDFSAAIFANLLDAESLTIWKDVDGIMSSDPKKFTTAQFISDLSYNEVIEMAYYGAQVIHPKTIKPLQNKNIPLYVRSFINPKQPGTVINSKTPKNLPPIKVIKENQVLVHLRSHDFSFVGEKPISQLYRMCGSLHITPNLLQTGAISIQLCIDDHAEKIEQLALLASEIFDVQLEKGLTLLTIRHYKTGLVESMTEGKEIVLLQKTTETVQVLYK